MHVMASSRCWSTSAARYAQGLAVGSGDVLTYCAAMAPLDPTDLLDLYWAGRTTLITRREDLPVYDEVFRAFFLDVRAPVQQMLKVKAQAAAEAEATFRCRRTEPRQGARARKCSLGLIASDVETLKHQSFGACTDEELAAIRRIMARIRAHPAAPPHPPHARLHSRPRPDMRRTVRESLRTHGEPVELLLAAAPDRLRPLILILDVSGSMADYSRSLLQFAYSAQASRAEGRGLLLRHPSDPDHPRSDAVAPTRRSSARGQLVVDWEGGTRIGEALDLFVRNWGRRGLCRGGVVVICSDGLDRGDPDCSRSRWSGSPGCATASSG